MKNKNGFSLVEIIISAGVLGFALSALLAFFANSVALNENARNTTTAITHAQFVLEDISYTPYATAIAQIDAGFWTWSTTTQVSAQGLTPLNSETVTTTRSSTTPPEVTVSVSWRDSQQRLRNIFFTTMIGGA